MSGVTTLLHISFGSRLPLIQGPSFVYLAPALAIINSPEFLGLNGNVCIGLDFNNQLKHFIHPVFTEFTPYILMLETTYFMGCICYGLRFVYTSISLLL